MPPLLQALGQFLRAPKVIVGEIAGIVLAGVLGATVPQAGIATTAQLARLQACPPFVWALVQTFALDQVFRSGWFLALTLMASASLALIVFDQWKRLGTRWTQKPTLSHFEHAPFRLEFWRPARTASREARVEIWTERQVGLAGAAVFHTGLLLIIIAGALRALLGGDAVVDLLEGETLAPQASAWAAQWPGLWGRPVQLDQPVTLKAVNATRYADGHLRELKVQLEVGQNGPRQPVNVSVNRDLRLGGERLFLTSDFGPAALLEWQPQGATPKREALLLAEQSLGTFEAVATGPDGLRAYLRARMNDAGQPPDLFEVRVMKGGALLFTGDVRAGQLWTLPGGVTMALRGTPLWARLRGNRDGALGLAYTGFALVMAGAMLLFTFVKLDCCVRVIPAEGREKVWVALKPQRFAPWFQTRFQQLIRQHGGSEAMGEAAQSDFCSIAVFPENATGASDGHQNQPPDPDLSGYPSALAGAAPSAPLSPDAFKASRNHVLVQGLPAPVARLGVGLLLGICLVVLCGCHRVSSEQARKLVERYNQVVAEAYRRGDAKLIDPVVGPNEGKKVAGLIGVRLELGLTLDAEMLSLEVTGVETARDELRVRTQERWRYRNRRIGTGQQVGEASRDFYEMLYHFKKTNHTWLVEAIAFAAPPHVSRQQTPWSTNHQPPREMARQTSGKEALP